MRPFPWNAAIGFGLGVLRLSPRDFWAMTPREFALAIEAARSGALDDLMTRFPDAEGATRRDDE